MPSKIQQLSELSELLKSGVITSQEFEILKNEILNEKTEEQRKDIDSVNSSEEDITHQSTAHNNKKVILKSYPRKDGSFIAAPDIEFAHISNITSDEVNMLKSFLSKKQSIAPDEMTPDEKKLSHEIFTKKELENFYKKNKSQALVKVSLWFIFIAVMATVFYQLYTKNVFQLQDKISDYFSNQVKKDENINEPLTKQVGENENLKTFDEIQLTLTDASFKKAKLYLGEPDKYEFAFSHLTKGYAIYYDRVANGGKPKHLVLFLRMLGNQWGDHAAIEEIYSVDNNQKACFGIHCIKVSKSNNSNQEKAQLSAELIGQWSRPIGDGCQIFDDGRLVLGNSVSEIHFKYTITPPDIKLFYDKAFSKIPQLNIESGIEVGKCQLLDNKLIIDFSNFDSPYYGFDKHLVMNKE